MYRIDYTRLVDWLVPSMLRRNVLLSLAYALVNPVRKLYVAFMKYKTDSEYRLNHNSQVCYLEKVLNDRFDPEQKRINIIDGWRFNQLYIYKETEGSHKAVNLGTMFIRPSADFADTGVDFIVKLPSDLALKESERYEMKTLLNAYKLAGKRYKLV